MKMPDILVFAIPAEFWSAHFHAKGSSNVSHLACCPVCDSPVRSREVLRSRHRPWKRRFDVVMAPQVSGRPPQRPKNDKWGEFRQMGASHRVQCLEQRLVLRSNNMKLAMLQELSASIPPQ